MRNSFILSAMAFAALTMVGCAQDDVVHESPSVNNAIQFGTYIGRTAQTRASVVDLDVVRTEGFGVFAFYTGTDDFDNNASPNFMYNQLVTCTQDVNKKWTYTPVKYWPNNEDDKVSFFAYAPYDANQTWPMSTYSSNTEILFEVNEDVQQQKDLLWNKTPQLNLQKPDVDSVIKFNFGHALARIGFKLAGAFDQVEAGGNIDKNTVITVKKVMLSGEEHTYNGPDNVTWPVNGVLHARAYLDLTQTGDTPSWNTEQGALTLTWSSDNTGDFKENNNILKDGNDSERALNGDNAYAMVIPQTFDNNSSLYVYIEYEVETTDNTATDNYSKITNYISKKVELPNNKLEAGKAYTLNLVLGMTTVKLSTDITDWDTKTNVNVDLPANNAPTATLAA